MAQVERKSVADREAELRAQQPKNAPVSAPVEKDDDGEYDGTGNRLHAVREGKVDPAFVQGGLTQVLYVDREIAEDKEQHTGRFISETTFGKPKGREVEEHTVFHEGDVVEGLSEEELRPLLTSGAVRRETKDEAKDK